jgi:hypothetical protein
MVIPAINAICQDRTTTGPLLGRLWKVSIEYIQEGLTTLLIDRVRRTMTERVQRLQ